MEVIDKRISDHFLLRADIDTLKPKKLQHTVQSRDIKRLDKAAFLSDATSSLSLSTISAECLVSTLQDTLDKHALVVPRTISVQPVTPWYTLDIKEAKRKRRQTERRWRKSGLQVHRDILAHQRNIINSLIRSHKKAYFTKKLEEVKTTKELFQTTDHLMGHQTSSSLPPGEDKELCNQFLLTFNNKVDNIRTFLGNDTPLPDEHEPSTGNTMTEFCYVTEEEIIKYIKAYSPKTFDLDPIPTSLLKEYTMELVPYITKIINESLATGVVPGIFKRAIVTPLLKKPGLDETDLKNFRPVSNLNFLSKILEKVVLGQVLKHVKSNGFDEVLQSAYKMHHSTETALLKVISDILDLVDDKNLCLLVLLDLTAAFDTIDHEILLNRLKKSFLVSGTVLTWFESYLTNRFYCVKVRNETSQNLPLKYGVPQGSVLGPVLFTMYTKPLSALIRKHSISYHLDADDTQLYGASDTENIHQLIHTTTHCIQNISSWMNINKLKLNEDKTDIIIFGCSKSIDSLPVVKFDLNGHEVLCSKKVKKSRGYMRQRYVNVFFCFKFL